MSTALAMARNLVRSLDLDEAARHSFRDFHAVGVDYINLLRSPRLTVKLYLFDPARLDAAGPNGQAVNPHTHGYCFETSVLRGAVRNVVYEKDTLSRPGPRDLAGWHEQRYRSPLRGGPVGHEDAGETTLRVAEARWYYPGESYAFDDERIHSIEVADRVPTALLLTQHADVDKPHTLLYTPTAELPSLEGLYRPFPKGEILAALDDLFGPED